MELLLLIAVLVVALTLCALWRSSRPQETQSKEDASPAVSPEARPTPDALNAEPPQRTQTIRTGTAPARAKKTKARREPVRRTFRRRVFKTSVECPGIGAVQRGRVIGQTVTLRKSRAACGADVILGDVVIGQLDAAVGAQVASAIDRGLAFTAVIQRAFSYEPLPNAATWADLKVEYLLEKGQPAIEMADAPYLFVDTETTGLPRFRHAAPWDFSNWPRLVEIAWLLVDGERREIDAASYIIKPQGFTVPWDAVQKHGITTDVAVHQGVEIGTALDAFVKDLRRAAVLISHNIEYDQGVLGAELLRAGCPNYLYNKKCMCTMQSAAAYCAIPGRFRDYKYPKLSDLHCKLFGHPYREVHRALPDVRAVQRCYFALKDRGIMA